MASFPQGLSAASYMKQLGGGRPPPPGYATGVLRHPGISLPPQHPLVARGLSALRDSWEDYLPAEAQIVPREVAAESAVPPAPEWGPSSTVEPVEAMIATPDAEPEPLALPREVLSPTADMPAAVSLPATLAPPAPEPTFVAVSEPSLPPPGTPVGVEVSPQRIFPLASWASLFGALVAGTALLYIVPALLRGRPAREDAYEALRQAVRPPRRRRRTRRGAPRRRRRRY